ncbi:MULTISPECIES: CarD family transcriptional regulator [Anaeromyxobacter]|uniref:CarD family transcriptional regulator n=1 Tax=Anaeromyxobacter TaxID=161492 RepID=UPI001F57EDF6|nr:MULTISPECIES: CarD family transcriptional regulator [unclassified Anaeromyxobacter]
MRGPPPRHPDEQREQLPAVEGVIADAAELQPGNRVVYPNQGVCEVVGVEEKDIAGQKLQLVRMRREEDGAAVLVPKNKVPSIGLRRVATGEQIEGVFHFLAAQFEDPELDWKVRHRDNADRLIAGGVLGVAEVVKGLHSLSRIRPLPAKEREQYDNARHLLVHEVAVSLGVPPALAEDYIDYALMPPAGVKFDLKPPPTPVLLPSRPKRRRPAATEEEGIEDLGLGDLGLGDLDLGEALAAVPEGEAAEGEGAEGAEGAEGEAEGEAPAEGAAEGAEATPGAEETEEEAAPRKARKAAAPKVPAPKAEKREAKRAAAKEPRRKAEKPAKAEKPSKKPAARKAAAPAKKAEKPAAKKTAPKPAAKRGGKKK